MPNAATSSVPYPGFPAASLTDLRQAPVPYWRLSGWYFFYFAFVGCFLPYFSLYLKSLGLSAWDIGVLMSLMPLMRMLAPAFWGWLADRRGHKTKLIRNTLVASVITFAGFLLTREFMSLALTMVVMSLFWSASLPLVEALTLGHLRHHVERYGRVRLWGSMGFIVAVQGVGFLLVLLPVVSIPLICLFLLFGALLIAMWLPESEPVATDHGGGGLRAVLTQPAVINLLAAGFMMSAAHAPLYTFLSIHLVDLGYGKAVIGGLWSLGVVAEIMVFAFMPRLLMLGSLRSILLICFFLAVLRFLIIGWLAAWPAAIIGAQLLHGATFGAHHAASITALNRWFPPHHQGTVQSLYGSVSFGAGGVVGGLLAGYIWETQGAGPTYSLAALFALAGLSLVWRGLRGS